MSEVNAYLFPECNFTLGIEDITAFSDGSSSETEFNITVAVNNQLIYQRVWDDFRNTAVVMVTNPDCTLGQVYDFRFVDSLRTLCAPYANMSFSFEDFLGELSNKTVLLGFIRLAESSPPAVLRKLWSPVRYQTGEEFSRAVSFMTYKGYPSLGQHAELMSSMNATYLNVTLAFGKSGGLLETPT